MSATVGQVLEVHGRPPPVQVPRAPLMVVGAGGVLGGEVTRRLIGAGAWQPVTVLTREPLQMALKGVQALDVAAWGDDPACWPSLTPRSEGAGVAVVMFEPPRPYHQRERALWTPTPDQLPALARWLLASGVGQLAVLTPHATGRLPEALKHGLANLDEAAVSALPFASLLWLRTAETRRPERGLTPPARLADWMLGIFKYMVPDAQRPLRAEQLAAVTEAALRLAPAGVHVLSPELLRAAARAPGGDALAAALGVTHRVAGAGTIAAMPPTS